MTHVIDPIEALRPAFRAGLTAAFGPEFADEDPILRPSAHADLQANLAMGLAKRLKQKPQDTARALCDQIPRGDLIERLEISGPGFINVTLTDRWVAAAATTLLGDERLGVPLASPPERVVVDYSSPNVAKEMHVGHLRGTIIGDALVRLLSWVGHTVIRQNHLGDWGTPFGMLIEHLLDLGENQATSELAMGELSSFYKAARNKFNDDPAFADRARQRVVMLQGGDPETLRHWGVLVELSQRYFSLVYQKLGVTMTPADAKGESFYNPRLGPLCDELVQAGHARIDDGATCVFVPGFVGKEKQPLPLIIRKKDGGFGYATTDLAAIRHRLDDLKATRVLYLVGAPQEQHLAMIYGAASLFGWLRPPARAEHVSFGSVLGTDKKMFKTRQGDTVRLIDLLDAAVEKAEQAVRERFPDLDEATVKSVGTDVGIGAVKYADLSCDRGKDYVFDLDRMIRFEGKTAGYVQYAHARTQSIFRKAGDDRPGDAVAIAADASGPHERALLLKLLGFAPAVRAVEQSLLPHLLCVYLYELADTFSSFYEHCDVLKAPPSQRPSRLAACELTARVLRTGLSLLGIAAPSRM